MGGPRRGYPARAYCGLLFVVGSSMGCYQLIDHHRGGGLNVNKVYLLEDFGEGASEADPIFDCFE
jgi:hypothetical protein